MLQSCPDEFTIDGYCEDGTERRLAAITVGALGICVLTPIILIRVNKHFRAVGTCASMSSNFSRNVRGRSLKVVCAHFVLAIVWVISFSSADVRIL